MPVQGKHVLRTSRHFALVLFAISFAASAQNTTSTSGHCLFAWAGDVEKKGSDFLAVIDADPSSQSYGRLMTTVATEQTSMQVHHTEYTMPSGGLVFANDHLAGRTFVFDLRDALHPSVVTSFTDMAGYSHPHSFLRLPNGNVLASFQHMHHAGTDMAVDSLGHSGGLVEIDDKGNVVRSVSNIGYRRRSNRIFYTRRLSDFSPVQKAHPALPIEELPALADRLEAGGHTVMDDALLAGKLAASMGRALLQSHCAEKTQFTTQQI